METKHCPKCGTQARVAVLRIAHVRCALNEDGSMGRVLSIGKSSPLPTEFECGGGHKWKAANDT